MGVVVNLPEMLKQTSISDSDTSSIKIKKKKMHLNIIYGFMILTLIIQCSNLGIVENFFSNWSEKNSSVKTSYKVHYFSTYIVSNYTNSTINEIKKKLKCNENGPVLCFEIP